MEFTRRTFVAAAAAVVLAGPSIALGAVTISAFAATSGRRFHGLLTTADPARDEAALESLRRRTGYFRPLAYASTDRGKTAFAAAAIDYHIESGMGFAVSEHNGAGHPGGVIPAEPGRFPNLEQLAAFLTGCAYGAAAGVGHPLKRALVARYQAMAV